jgi:hypothetical protein
MDMNVERIIAGREPEQAPDRRFAHMHDCAHRRLWPDATPLPGGRIRLAVRNAPAARHRQRRGSCGRPGVRRSASGTRAGPSDSEGSDDPEPPGLALPQTGRQQTAGEEALR